MSVMEIAILKDRLKGKVIIVGIGNVLRGDDGAGPELIKSLELRVGSLEKDSQLSLIDAGEVPENYLEKIAGHKPDTILLIDAVDFGSSPGAIKIIGQDAIRNDTLSTHNASLKLVIDYLRKETKANILLLGIQPGNVGMDHGLSEPVKQALDRIEEYLAKCMSSA